MSAPSSDNVRVCVRVRPSTGPGAADVAWSVTPDGTLQQLDTLGRPCTVLAGLGAHATTRASSQPRPSFSALLTSPPPPPAHSRPSPLASRGPSSLADRVFSEQSSTPEIFDVAIKDLVASVVDGYNGTVFAYGQTAAGKTHTMLGSKGTPGSESTRQLARAAARNDGRCSNSPAPMPVSAQFFPSP
jgi:hypothetical protein